MRNILVLLLAVCACGGDDGGSGKVDAAIDDATIVDTAAIVDASPDAPALTVTSACMNMCDKLASCLGAISPDDLQACIDSCETDLADCSFDQLTDLDACNQATCTGDDPTQWEVGMCIAAVSCVDTPIISG